MSGFLIGTIGMLLIVCLPETKPNGRLAGYYLTQATATGFVCLLSLLASNVAGYTKKTTVAAIYLILYCVGNIIGPQTFRPSDAPRYVPAEILIIVCYCACALDMVVIWWYYRRLNKKNALARMDPGYTKLENQDFLDLTDKENKEFVYTL